MAIDRIWAMSYGRSFFFDGLRRMGKTVLLTSI